MNGKPILVRGGGWTPDMMLRNDPEKLRAQFRMVRDMGLNTIRSEGKMEPEDFFNLADEQGVLVMIGWSCCDRWERWTQWTDENKQVARQSLDSQMLRLRIHPSVMMWLNGSDHHPTAEIESMYLKEETDLHWPNPTVSSATRQSDVCYRRERRKDERPVRLRGAGLLGDRHQHARRSFWFCHGDRAGTGDSAARQYEEIYSRGRHLAA